MIEKRGIRVIMKVVALLCLNFVGNAIAIENFYTFSGDYTYGQVLTVLSLKSGRSVLGSSDGLNMKRGFEIYNKTFSTAVDHVSKDLRSDGYRLFVDSTCFYVVKNDSLDKGKNDTMYQTYEPYQKRYLITRDKMEYLNAKQVDNERRLADSVLKVPKLQYVYKCDLYIVGTTSDTLANEGLKIDDLMQVRVDAWNRHGGGLNFMIGVEYNQVLDSLNFKRHIIFYLRGDTSVSMIFGSENRRENSQITSSTGAVSTYYESVYDGLSIVVNPNLYSLTYRLNDNQIRLNGVPDSLIIGSSMMRDRKRTKSWLFFTYRTFNLTSFYLSSLLHISKVDSTFIKM